LPLALLGETRKSIDWSFVGQAMVSTAPARSFPHVEPGGYALWMEIIVGCMIFFLRKDVDDETTGDPCTREILNHGWTPVVLRTGHRM
jgi:hypothetical protein